MQSTRHRHVSLWTRIHRRLRRYITRKRIQTLDAQNLSDQGQSRQVADAVASATVRVMAHRIGIDPLDISTNSWLGNDIIRTCAQCTKRSNCRLWLADLEADDGEYKKYCPNAERFQKLMLQNDDTPRR